MAKQNFPIFICHSTRDADLTDLISQSLREADFRVWEDSCVAVGGDWQKDIQRELERANIFLLVVSPQSLGSNWTQFEFGVALGRAYASQDVQVIPIVLGDTQRDDLPKSIKKLDCLYANNMNFEELMAGIRERLERATSGQSAEKGNSDNHNHAS